MENRPLVLDLQDLESSINEIKSHDQKIRSILFRLISSSNKSFDVKFLDEDYKFNVPTTEEEREERDKLLNVLINKVLLFAYQSIPNGINDPSWNNILIFAQGADPLDHQFEKFNESASSEVESFANESGVPAMPLNEDNYQVKQELSDVEQDFTLVDKF